MTIQTIYFALAAVALYGSYKAKGEDARMTLTAISTALTACFVYSVVAS